MVDVHPSAVVDPGAKLADGVRVGPFAYVGPGVVLEAGVELANHASVDGHTRIGPSTRVFPFASVGGEPQDRKFDGESSQLVIGSDNVIRENATVHVGTSGGGGITRIGDDNLIMNGAHIGHDTHVGSHCIVGAFCGVAGHVEISDHAVLGAFTGVHQFTRIGESVMAAASSMLSQDAPPFALVAGDRARVVGVNRIGIERRGLSSETRRELKHAFHVIFSSRLRLGEAAARLRGEHEASAEVERLLRFLETSARGYCRT